MNTENNPNNSQLVQAIHSCKCPEHDRQGAIKDMNEGIIEVEINYKSTSIENDNTFICVSSKDDKNKDKVIVKALGADRHGNGLDTRIHKKISFDENQIIPANDSGLTVKKIQISAQKIKSNTYLDNAIILIIEEQQKQDLIDEDNLKGLVLRFGLDDEFKQLKAGDKPFQIHPGKHSPVYVIILEDGTLPKTDTGDVACYMFSDDAIVHSIKCWPDRFGAVRTHEDGVVKILCI